MSKKMTTAARFDAIENALGNLEGYVDVMKGLQYEEIPELFRRAKEWEALEHRVKTLEANKGIESSGSSGTPQVGERLAIIETTQMELGNALKGLSNEVKDVVAALRMELSDMASLVKVMMMAIGSGPQEGGASERRGKLKIPKPRPYVGERDAQKLENFVFDLDQYFNAAGIESEKAQLNHATMFLVDNAKVWWRTKYQEIQEGRCQINTWDDLKQELKAHFYPENVDYLARRKLRELRQTGSVQDYVKKFTTVMLDIRDMTEKDKLFYFLDGLSREATMELQRGRVQNLSEAVMAAERLSDYDFPNSTMKFVGGTASTIGGGAGQSSKGSKPKSGGVASIVPTQMEASAMSQPSNIKKKKTLSCFLCRGPHKVAECPEKAALNALHARLQSGGAGGNKERLKKEQEEKEHKKKEKAEAHLYTIIKVARDEDLAEQIGKEIYFDLVDHNKVRSFRVQKQMSFNLFKEEVTKEFGIPVQFQRFWLWAKRQNHTYRPNRPLTHMEEGQSVGQLREVSNKAHNAELKLFLEVELGLDKRPIAPPGKTKDDILLFFKLYDPEKEELRYVGRLFVRGNGKPAKILTRLNELVGYDPEEEIVLYEEIKFEPNVMCEPIDKKIPFRSSQLEDGDIVCFQKAPLMGSDEQYRYPDVPSYLEYVHNRQVVHFRSLEKPKEADFCLEMSRLYTYDDVVEKVAQQLGLDDPSKIRLTPHNCYSQQPKPQPIKYRGVDHLSDMLVHYNQTLDILYYEILDIPLPELQGLKTLKVAFHHATKDEVVMHTIRLAKQSTVGDVLDDLKAKVELSHPNAELRLLEVFYHKIYKVFPPTEKIENINDQYWTLRAEEIPEEEKSLGSHGRLIHVYHFTKDTAQNQMQIQNFGEPFVLVIHEGETLAEIKVRIQKKLQVRDEEFAKWKFAFLSQGRPEYLQDSDIVSSHFQRRDVYGAWEQYLGLEHTDNAPKRAYAVNQNRHTYEKPVKIYN